MYSGRGVLDVNRSSSGKTNPSKFRSKQTVRVLLALWVFSLSLSFQTSFHLTNSLLIINRTILTTFFVFLWRTIQHLMHTKSLLFVGLYPITGATYLFLVMPLATCFAFPEDLPATVNPLKPKDYAFLIKKTWFAMKRNNLKVEGKDLWRDSVRIDRLEV